MINKTLDDLIKEAGYPSKRAFAREMGVNHGVIIAYGRGDTVPRLDSTIAMAKKLKVSLKTLCAAMGQDVSDIPDDCTDSRDMN